MTVRTITWEGIEAIELTTPALRLVGTAAYGPRLGWFGPAGGENLLLWAPGKYRREAPGREAWDLRGGHRTWIAGPRGDECEMTYNADNAAGTSELRPDGFVLTGARDDQNGTRRGIAVTAVNERTLAVDSFVTNDSDMLLGAAVWALTCTVPMPETRYVVPLGDGSNFDAVTIVHFKTWAGHGQNTFADAQFTFQQDAMVIVPQGLENKRMIQSHAGIIAMSDPTRKLTFAKRIEFSADAHYPLGTNIAAYIGPKNFMVEMETMGGEACVKPGQTLHHVETWTLHPGALEELTGAAARALFA